MNSDLFGLQWEHSPLSEQINFMDLTLSIQNDKIVCSLYDKPSNLHMYIPPASCHPPGTLSGLIYGHLWRIYKLCTNPQDQTNRIRLFIRHLQVRGYQHHHIIPMIRAAQRNILSRQPPATQDDASTDDDEPDAFIFWHMKFNPQNPSSSVVQAAWKNTTLGHKRLIVAYSKHPNLGNLLSYRNLTNRPGPTISSYLD